MKKKSKKLRDEEATISNEGTTEAFKATLLADNQFKTYRGIIKHIAEQTNFDALEKEAQRLHSGRKSRSLGTVPGADAVMEAAAQDGSNRSRLTQICVDLIKIDDILAEALEAIRAHIMFTYADKIPDGRTKADRVAYLNQYLRKGVKLKAQVESMMNRINFYIKDVDQMSFTLARITDVLKMIYDKSNSR